MEKDKEQNKFSDVELDIFIEEMFYEDLSMQEELLLNQLTDKNNNDGEN